MMKNIMARPIKETPILTGKDAKRFEKAMKENEHRPVSEAEIMSIKNAWQQFEIVFKKHG
jgi:hypothetical protein